MVENGGLGAIVATEPLAPGQIRNLVGLVAAGSPLAAAVQCSVRSGYKICRIIGDPATEIASVNGLPITPLLVDAEGADGFRAARSSILTMSARIGGELFMLSDRYADQTELTGLREREVAWLTITELFDQFTEPDGFLQVNGEVLLSGGGITEEVLETRVRSLFADVNQESSGREQSPQE